MDSPDLPDAAAPDDGGNLAEAFLRLSPAARRDVHRQLCEAALVVWLRFAAEQKQIRYIDSVVGVAHTVDLDLPADAFREAFAAPEAAGAAAEAAVRAMDDCYAEPMAALQDDDLEFPDHIEYAYYAIYNAFQKYARGRETDDWLIVNQALSANPDKASWRPVLIDAIRAAEGRTGEAG